MKSAIIMIVALMCVFGDSAVAQDKKPNIILILTDDQRADTLEYMPKLNELLVQRGTLFPNAIITTPTCCPSRATILTGQYAHNHGVRQNEKEFTRELDKRDSQTLATWLKAGGYKTGLIGKYLNGYSFGYIPPGWDTFQAFGKRHYYNYKMTNFIDGVSKEPRTYGSSEADYSTDVLAAKAVDFIKSADDGDKPFFLIWTPNAPHRPAVPARRHEQTFADLSPHRPPSFNVSDKGFWDRKWWSKGGRALSANRIAKIDAMRKGMLQTLLAVDEAIEKIVNTLVASNKLENTIIIFLGDNGFHWGEHQITDKRSPYDESIRVGMVIFDGRDQTKRTNDALVANIDLAPTILDYAGLKTPDTVDGVSILPLLSGEKAQLRNHVLIQIFPETFASTSNAFIGVRGANSVYFERDGLIWASKEYFDMTKDPHQLKNLVTDPDFESDVAAHRAALNHLRSCAGASCNQSPKAQLQPVAADAKPPS